MPAGAIAPPYLYCLSSAAPADRVVRDSDTPARCDRTMPQRDSSFLRSLSHCLERKKHSMLKACQQTFRIQHDSERLPIGMGKMKDVSECEYLMRVAVYGSGRSSRTSTRRPLSLNGVVQLASAPWRAR